MLKAFKSRRMDIIADEADDGLNVKVLWEVCDTEEDDRRIHKLLEQRARDTYGPRWMQLASALRVAADLEVTQAKALQRLAVDAAEGRTRAQLAAEQRTSFATHLQRIGTCPDVVTAVYVASHALVTQGLAAEWLSMCEPSAFMY
jgi:hypothetical protein